MSNFSRAEIIGHVPDPTFAADERIDLVARPCACGVNVFADRNRPGEQYRRHWESERHQEWWREHEEEWQGPA